MPLVNSMRTNMFRRGEQKHIDWVNSYYDLLAALEGYVKKHHQTGVTWNAKGADAREVLNSLSDSKPASSAVGSGAPPPPPPPPPGPPPVLGLDGPSTPQKSSGDIGDVFAEINRGSDITSGLRKVDRSQMTHKNPEIRAGSLVPARTPSSGSLRAKSPAPPSKSKPAHLTKKKPPKLELDGNKWIVVCEPVRKLTGTI
jgi:adenylyl cyclase-associated protein